jgi:hypothetical protein
MEAYFYEHIVSIRKFNKWSFVDYSEAKEK